MMIRTSCLHALVFTICFCSPRPWRYSSCCILLGVTFPVGLWARSGPDHRVQPHRGRGKLWRGGPERREGRGKAGAAASPGHPERPQPRQGERQAYRERAGASDAAGSSFFLPSAGHFGVQRAVYVNSVVNFDSPPTCVQRMNAPRPPAKAMSNPVSNTSRAAGWTVPAGPQGLGGERMGEGTRRALLLSVMSSWCCCCRHGPSVPSMVTTTLAVDRTTNYRWRASKMHRTFAIFQLHTLRSPCHDRRLVWLKIM